MRNWLIFVVLCIARLTCAQTQIANESATGKTFQFASDGLTRGQLCSGGPPNYCARYDVIRNATAPPVSLTGLTGAGNCAIDNELGEVVCRVTDGNYNAFRGFRTQSDSNSGTVSLDGNLFSFVDQTGIGYLESVDRSTFPPTFHARGTTTTCFSGEAVSFSHVSPKTFYGSLGNTNIVGINKCVLNQASPVYVSATPTTNLSGTSALTVTPFLDPTTANCLGNEYFPYVNSSDLYNADPNDQFFSMQLRGSQDEGFLMVYFDTTIPGCHWWNTRTMTEGGSWGYNSTQVGALGTGTGTGPIQLQPAFLLPVPPTATAAAARTATGTIPVGTVVAVCDSLVQRNVGETPCSNTANVTMNAGGCGGLDCNSVTVVAPNIFPSGTQMAGTGYNVYACAPAGSCTPTLQNDGGATKPMTAPTGFSIACTAGCTGTTAYDYRVWIFAIVTPTTTLPGNMSVPTAPFNICSTSRAGCNLVGTFGVHPTWTLTYTPPANASAISIQHACTSPSLAYCANPQNFIWDQVKQFAPCPTPPCTTTVNLVGSGGDNTRIYETDGVSTNRLTLPNATITTLLTGTVTPPTQNGTGTKIHDNRGGPDGKWGMASSITTGNFNATLLGSGFAGNGGEFMHDHATGFTVLITTSKGGATGNPFNIVSAATGHKVLGYGVACAQDSLIDGVMIDCWPEVDSPAGMEAGLRHLNNYFLGFPEDNGAHHLSVQAMAPYAGVSNGTYPLLQGITQFEEVTLPASALVGTVFGVGLGLPGYSPISGSNAGQTNNQNRQYRLCNNWNSATSDDGAGAFNSEVSGNFAPDGRSGIFTSDMGIGSPTGIPPAGGPQLGDILGNFPAVCAAGSTGPAQPQLCSNARTDIYWCEFR